MTVSGDEQAAVVIVLGSPSPPRRCAHARDVLNYYGIAFKEVRWNEFPDLLASGMPSLRAIILATGVAYTDEHIVLPADIIVPILRVVTDPEPPPNQILKNTALTAEVGRTNPCHRRPCIGISSRGFTKTSF